MEAKGQGKELFLAAIQEKQAVPSVDSFIRSSQMQMSCRVIKQFGLIHLGISQGRVLRHKHIAGFGHNQVTVLETSYTLALCLP